MTRRRSGRPAQGINDRGQIVGFYADAGGADHGFLLSGGHYTTLDDPNAVAGSTAALATGINARGQVVGYYNDASSRARLPAERRPLHHARRPQFLVHRPLGINDRGQIVGLYHDASFGVHGFLLSGGQYTTLDDPNAAGESVATGINDSGQIVGYYTDASDSTHGFIATADGACGGDRAQTVPPAKTAAPPRRSVAASLSLPPRQPSPPRQNLPASTRSSPWTLVCQYDDLFRPLSAI